MKNDQLSEEQQRAVVNFVRKKKYRRERTLIKFIEKHFVEDGPVYLDVVYEIARLVEQGPLEWLAPDEARVGPDRYSEAELRYRYAPWKDTQLVLEIIEEEKEKEMNDTVELSNNSREITALVQLLGRRRKKNKPLETTLEALNKLGSRRPTKQRFSVHFDKGQLKFIVYMLHEETVLPAALHHAADEIICKPTKIKFK